MAVAAAAGWRWGREEGSRAASCAASAGGRRDEAVTAGLADTGKGNDKGKGDSCVRAGWPGAGGEQQLGRRWAGARSRW